MFVGGLEDGIDDPELHRYFSEFGFVTRALRIPNRDEPKRKFGFVDFDDYDAVDIVVSQREHFIGGHRVRVELALPLVNDSLYEKDLAGMGPSSGGLGGQETWMEKVQRKLQFAVPDQGLWGETMNNYEVFVQGGADVQTTQFRYTISLIVFRTCSFQSSSSSESLAECSSTWSAWLARLLRRSPTTPTPGSA